MDREKIIASYITQFTIKMSTKKISFNIIFNYIGVFGQILIAFILAPFLINTLGDTKYGIWSIVSAFTGYMSLLDLGVSSAVNRYVSKYMAQNDIDGINTIVSSALALFILMSLFIFALSPLMATMIVNFLHIDKNLIELVYILIIIVSFDVGIFIVGNTFRGLFRGLQRYDITNMVQIISTLYKSIMFFIFLSKGYDLDSMGYISLSSNIISIILLYIMLKWKFPFVKIHFAFINKKRVQQIIRFSKFTFLAMFANQIIYYSDAFVIGYFLSAASVTYYSIPWSLAEYTKKMCLAISRTYAPAFSEKESVGDMDGVRSLFISGTKLMIIVSNLLSIGVLFFGGSLIAIWIGPKYKELCETVLVILFINQFVMGPQLISYALLQGLSKQKTYSYAAMLVSVINLSLSINFVQYWGIVGVAIGAMIPQVLFHGIFVPIHTLKSINLPMLEYLKKTYIRSIFPSVVLALSLFFFVHYYFPNNYFKLLGFSVISAAIYMIMAYFTMLSNTEKEMLLKYLPKYKIRNV